MQLSFSYSKHGRRFRLSISWILIISSDHIETPVEWILQQFWNNMSAISVKSSGLRMSVAKILLSLLTLTEIQTTLSIFLLSLVSLLFLVAITLIFLLISESQYFAYVSKSLSWFTCTKTTSSTTTHSLARKIICL